MTETATSAPSPHMRKRPLSPHLQIYRWQWSNTLSILHRMTGLGLTIGLVVLTAWLVCGALGAASYNAFQDFCVHSISIICLTAWAWCLSYHLLNGIRHLYWDAGTGYALKTAAISGWAVVIGSVLITWIALGGAVWQKQHPFYTFAFSANHAHTMQEDNSDMIQANDPLSEGTQE